MKNFHRPSQSLLALCLIVSFGVLQLEASSEIRIIALTGMPTPGVSDDAVFSEFSLPVLNRVGDIAFLSNIAGPAIDDLNDSANFRQRVGASLELLALEGEVVPGASTGVSFYNLTEPFLNSRSQALFFSQLREGGYIDRGIFSEEDGAGVSLLVRNEDAVSAIGAEVNFFGFGDLVFNSAGETAFVTSFRGVGVGYSSDTAIVREENGSGFLLIAREGEPAPGTSPGVNFGGQFTFGDPVLNDRGQVALVSRLIGSGIDSYNSGIFLTDRNDQLNLVVRGGDIAPGAEPGVTISRVYTPALNNLGHTAFAVRLAGTGINSSNDTALYRQGESGNLNLVIRAGDTVAGLDPGVVLSRISEPVLSGQDRIAFRALLNGEDIDTTNDSGIFKEQDNGHLVLVAREGETIPGLAPFTFSGRAAFGNPILNRNNQAAFVGFFENNRGIFAEDLHGNLHAIAYTGQLLDVSNNPAISDHREISDVSFITDSGNEDGRRSGFNDLGQLAFRAEFTDGSSGIFISNRVAIPEPTALSMLLPFALLLFSYRNRSAPSKRRSGLRNRTETREAARMERTRQQANVHG